MSAAKQKPPAPAKMKGGFQKHQPENNTPNQDTLEAEAAPTFNPTLPRPGTDAMTALLDLATRQNLMQIDWLLEGKSWRLAAEVFVLNELGWEIISNRKPGSRQAIYYLHRQARRAAHKMLGGATWAR